VRIHNGRQRRNRSASRRGLRLFRRRPRTKGMVSAPQHEQRLNLSDGRAAKKYAEQNGGENGEY
jgi:hypothetical protein